MTTLKHLIATQPTIECKSAVQLTQSAWLPILLLLKIILCLISLYATIYCTKKQGLAWLGHPNVKVLYCFHTFWTIYFPFFLAGNALFDGFRLLMYHDIPCDLRMSAKIAVPIRAIPVLGQSCQSLTMCAISIERAVATVYPTKYEQWKSPLFGVILGILAVIIALLEEICLILLPISWNSQLSITTVRTAQNADLYDAFIKSFIYVELITISLFVFIWLFNHRQLRLASKLGRSLGLKYQAKENKSVIQILLPCFIVHFILNFTSFGMIQVYFMFYKFNLAWFTIWLEIWTQAHLYSLIMPIILYYRLLKKNRDTVVNNGDSNEYFRHFHQMLNHK